MTIITCKNNGLGASDDESKKMKGAEKTSGAFFLPVYWIDEIEYLLSSDKILFRIQSTIPGENGSIYHPVIFFESPDLCPGLLNVLLTP